jgi:hypothetical protein
VGARADRANAAGADVLCSIHHNAGVNGGAGGGVAVYVAANASAASRALQSAVYDAVIRLTGLRGNRANPMPAANVSVLLTRARMPCILPEYGFMDSRTDVPIILTDDHAYKCAAGTVEGIAGLLGLARRAAPQPAMPAVTVTLNGREMDFDVPPLVVNGRTMVPLRAIAEAFGADVAWDPEARTVSIVT